ncbi:MAG: DRTGG domain-containing protein [Smithellaceae bacterium]
MTLQEVKDILDAEVIVGHDRLGVEVTKAGCSDMVSEIMVFCKAGTLLLTGLNNPQIIRAADILSLAAVVLVRGKRPSLDMIQLAKALQIPVLATKYILFESAGRLFANGIVGVMGKNDES